MKSVLRTVFLIMAVLFAPAVWAADARVALELVLAVDASSSVDDAEYQLQVIGYAKAFRDPDIIAAIDAIGEAGIAVTYVEWSSTRRQVQTVGWTHVHDERSAKSFAQAIARDASQVKASGTAIGEAVLYSIGLFKNNGFRGDRRTIDVSADDRYNAGSAPSYAQGIARANKVTVNGLAVDPTGVLTGYFRENVIAGPGAFVMTAKSFDAFAAAIKRKLLRELGQNSIAGLERANF